jgi:hypothetical protein
MASSRTTDHFLQGILRMRCLTWPSLLLALSVGAPPPVFAADAPEEVAPKPQKPVIDRAVAPGGYLDADRDGRNDHFRDADGDGVDDVSGRKYPHRFPFVDADGDGRNDLFRDLDGDGVNDLSAKLVDADGDGVCDNVIDYDGDGKNDVTGLSYTPTSLKGYRLGRVDEERATVHRRFRDKNGDGMNDLLRRLNLRGDGYRDRSSDSFIDEDGDGISDGRRLQIRDRVRRRYEGKNRRSRPPPNRDKRPKPHREAPKKERK